MLKQYLEKNNLTYEEKWIDQDGQVREEMLEISGGFLGIPFTVIENNSEVDKVIGFDRGKFDMVLGLD